MKHSTKPTPALSYWLQQAMEGEQPYQPLVLDRQVRADVCIVGGGFTGLWTALEIKQQRPESEVVLIDRGLCGSGASGRNGGFVLSLWAKYLSLEKMCGEGEALRLCRASTQAIIDLQEFCRRHSIDAEMRMDGWLWAATSEAQVGAWDPTVSALERLGQAAFDRVTPGGAAALGGSPAHRAGVFERISASVQPAKLARGLKACAQQAGVRIYECSPMVRLDRGVPATVHCELGGVKAKKVVLAMNAWGSAFSEIRKAIVVVSSDIIVTRPVPELLTRLGWHNGMTISDCRMLVHYYRTTHDGRIVFGKGGGSGHLAYGGNVTSKFDGASKISDTVTTYMREIYNDIAPNDVVQSWMGPIDRSRNGLPLFGSLSGDSNILYGVGYSGNGVGPSILGGKILCALALDIDNEWSQCGLVQPLLRAFPPEPFRYLGGRLVCNAIRKLDLAADEGRSATLLVKTIASLAPAGLSPTSTKQGRSESPPQEQSTDAGELPMNKSGAPGIVRAVTAYYDALYFGDATRIDAAFDPGARLVGDANGTPIHLTTSAWADVLGARPSPSAQGQPYALNIRDVRECGDAALVELATDLNGIAFTDYISLVRRNGHWRIIFKLFSHNRTAP
ncbi:MAG: O-acetylhomoserine sulfhydrylase [Massilia sp.]|nr:O-acetylhomoserine sulfhydrylase [Massilia sp.]